MPLSDVKVIIDLKKPSALIGLGTPLILVEKTGASTYKEYLDPQAVIADFTEDSDAYRLYEAIYEQGDNRPYKVAIATFNTTDTTAVAALRKYFFNDWYFVLLVGGAIADKIAISDEVELQDLKVAGHLVTSQSDLSALKDKEYTRTFAFYHTVAGEFPQAALIGEAGSQPVGSITWKFKNLSGITPSDVSPTDLNNIHSEGGILYLTKAGIDQTSEGQMVSGEYIDVIHSKDWVKLNLEQALQYLLSTTKKIPYTNQGITQIEDTARTVFETAGRMGIINEGETGYSYTLNTLSREESLPSDRLARKYNGLSFSFEIAGAIHEATVHGEILF